ncbi:MAG: DNA polymerase III subunit epsilon [Chloroflexi bacterium]|nr:DNA polymerase III subunit epsilon [Chloroflexota bacterium]
MTTTYVTIDVETTGLDANNDRIIEVAAVTFRDNEILDEFSSLVNPHRDLPPYITQLTGITQEMVDGAPGMFGLRSKLRSIIGDHVLVGHNVSFDAGFLKAERLAHGNHRVDTVTLATILFPDAGRFGLEALAYFLNLPTPDGGQTHRALDDAVLTIELFLALKEQALKIPLAQLDELVLAGQNLSWPETIFFEDILGIRARTAFEGGEMRQRGRLPRYFKPPKLNGRPATPREKPIDLDPDLVASLIRPGGNFEQTMTSYEYRLQQEEMLLSVVDALNFGSHVIVEAPTGTGKSIAYLIPAAFWAVENGRRVVISTNTINLQDQLIHKDIPELQRILPFELHASVRKGRSNYLCTRLFQQMRHSGPSNADEMNLFARILLWLGQTQVGDVAELNLRTPGERLAWSRLNGDNVSCSLDQCAQENCPLHHARRSAELSHIVIVNHALLLSDVANEGHILPDFVDLIVDEAHHIESAVTNGLSFRADRKFLEAILDEINKPRAGLLADLQNRVQAAMPGQFAEQFDTVVNMMRREGQVASSRLDEFFMTLSFFLSEFRNRRSKFAEQFRLTPDARAQTGYDEVELSWDNLNNHLKMIVDGFVKLAGGLADVQDQFDIEEVDELRAALLSNGRSLEETRANLDQIIIDPQEGMIYWVEIFKERISLHAAPLHIGPLVQAHIFEALETVILTSATLRTANPGSWDSEPTFDYIRERLYAYEVDELAVDTPFDYKNTTLLYLPTDMPEPNQPGYQRFVEEAIVDVALALNGRTLALFTSYGQLNQTAKAIEPILSDQGITTLAQSSGSSRQQLLAQFKRPHSRSVLLGTRSFWEGVDVPGEALQAVMLVKLPFDVPSDPIFAARSETFENSFFEYSIPEAVLRFRQGFGRLIRRTTDEGVVVILDKRVLTKRYGQMFLDALPECMVLRQRTGRVGELTLRWLNRER